MEDKDLKTQVVKIVDGLLSDKEEAEIRKRTEIALKESADTITNLTTALEEKNTEVSEFESKLADKETVIQTLKLELEAARKELEVSNTNLTESKNELEKFMKDRAAEKRMAELIDAGVARSDKENQMNKVRDLSDEDFASYKEELVSLREAVKAELEKARLEAEGNAKAEAEAIAKAAEEKVAKDAAEKAATEKAAADKEAADKIAGQTADTDVIVQPAQITPGQAIMASLNVELVPKTVSAKYAELGQAMADKWKKNK